MIPPGLDSTPQPLPKHPPALDPPTVEQVLTQLEQCFGLPKPLTPSSPNLLDELIGRLLCHNSPLRAAGPEAASANSPALRALKTAYPNWEQVLTADPEALALVLPGGSLAALTVARLQALLAEIQHRQGSLQLNFLADLETQDALNYLLSLKGVGLQTAASVLLFGLGRDLCPVDTHVHRVANRLGLVRAKHPDETFVQLAHRIPAGKAYSLHVNLGRLGKRICKARMPECGRCPLRRACPSALLRQR